MREGAEGFVYWLKDETCRFPIEHGYVGVCSRLNVRIGNHRQNPGTHKGAIGVPPSFTVEVIFAGPIADCLKLESLLRPAKITPMPGAVRKLLKVMTKHGLTVEDVERLDAP